jgi:hypothetical protein
MHEKSRRKSETPSEDGAETAAEAVEDVAEEKAKSPVKRLMSIVEEKNLQSLVRADKTISDILYCFGMERGLYVWSCKILSAK